MDHPKGAGETGNVRLGFDRRVRLEFHGSKISSDVGLLLFRELDEVLGLHDIAGSVLSDTRTGHNRLHSLVGLLRQSVFGRLAGYDDVNDADRLALDPVMRQVVGGRAVDAKAASASQMGRFETEVLTAAGNRTALTDLPGQWIDRVHERKPPKWITLDMDSSVSPTHGAQEGTAWNGHFGCMCYHPLFVFNQFGHLERCALRPGNVHSADGWEAVLKPIIARYADRHLMRFFRGDAAFAMPKLYKTLEAERYYYAIRLRTNRVLQGRIARLLKRPVGRPPKGVKRIYGDFEYQAVSWDKPRRVIAKVEWHPGSRVSALSSPTCQWSRTGSSASTINAAPPSSTSRKASKLSTGHGCLARAWRKTRSAFSFTHWPTIWVSSCKARTFPKRWPTGL